MQFTLKRTADSERARPGRFTSLLVLALWLVGVVAQAGKFPYLLPVKSFRAGISASLQLSDVVMPALTLLMASLGAFIVLHSASRRFGWLMLSVGFSSALVSFTSEYSQYALLVAPEANLPLGRLAGWLQDLWPIPFVLLFSLPILFPDGKLPSPRWRPIFWLHTVGWGLFIVVFSFTQRPLTNAFLAYDSAPTNPLGLIPMSATVYNAAFAGLSGISVITGIASVVYRWRRTGGDVRQQIKLVVYAFLMMLMMLAVSWVNTILKEAVGIDLGLENALDAAVNLSLLGVLAALGLAVLKYRLYDIDLVINRTLVYGMLTVIVAGGYVLIVIALGAVVPSEGNLLPSLLAAGVIAALFAPLRERLQRGVNRLMFGERNDPYVVLSQLGRRLSSSAAPDATLDTIVETVAKTLKLPFVAIQLEQRGSYVVNAESGTRSGGEIALPLVHQNEEVGRLLVAPRSPGQSLASKDRQLLEDIAHQAGAVAHAVRLTADLQRSRRRLVTAREEERRRLRRDLHDGLGPTLASHTLKLDTAMDLIHEQPDAAIAQLQELYGQTQEIVAEIRRLVHQLRPPALDDLGLVGAVEAHIQHNRRQGRTPRIVVEGPPGGLPPLPAAVELAAYRITMEAVTNVIRHARAERCHIRYGLQNGLQNMSLQIEVGDDGQGLPDKLRHGVGMNSMRERAEELGGHVVIEAIEGGGTRVCAELPLPKESAA